MKKIILIFSAIIFFTTFSIKAEEPWSISTMHPVTNEVYKLGFVVTKKKNVSAMLTSLTQNFFKFYQQYLSKLDGSTCYYRPTCSRYASSVIDRYGIVKGSVMAADRLMRCHGNQTEPRFDPAVDLSEFNK